MGYCAAVSVVVAVSAATTLLPALLGALDFRINSLQVKLGKTHPDDHQPHGWARWARGVAGRPWISVVASVPLLLVLAAPRNLEFGSSDAGEKPESTTARQAFDLITEGFGPGANAPLLVAISLGSPAKADQSQLNQVDQQQQKLTQQQQQQTQQLEAEGVPADQAQQQVQQQTASQQQNSTSRSSRPPHPPPTPGSQTSRTRSRRRRGAVGVAGHARQGRHLRHVHGNTHHGAVGPEDRGPGEPPAVRRDPEGHQGHGREGLRGGQTAGYIDLANQISDKLLSMIAIVVGLSCIVLLLAFRSLLLPLKAAVANLLSGGRRLRRGDLRVPGGARREADRPGWPDPDRELRAAAHVRDPVRALHGLRGVPAHPDPGALQGVRTTRARR